jgi:hypothetical protein
MLPLQIADELTSVFPGLGRELHTPATMSSLAAQLARFASFTRLAFKGEQLDLLARCFAVADRLLTQADAELTAAFRDAYFPCLHLDALPGGERTARQLMPAALYGDYAQYLYADAHRPGSAGSASL